MNKNYIYLGILIVILLGANVWLKMNNEKLEWESNQAINDYNELYETIMVTEYNESSCFLWVMKEGNGFASPTDYCFQLKLNCNSNSKYHNLSCEWISSELVDSEGNLLNDTMEGCTCIGA